MKNTQLSASLKKICDTQEELAKGKFTTEERNNIPRLDEIPIQNPNHWIKIKKVICVFVDMKNSTALSAEIPSKETARAYQLFTETAVKIFKELDASFIDIKGDGVFALFNSCKPHTALSAAVTFKTYVEECFLPRFSNKETKLGVHIGIDSKDVLVKRLGVMRTDWQNPVWAGKPY